MIDLQELRKLAEAASNLFPDKWEENDEEVVSGGLTISCVNGPYCDPHIGAKSIAKYQAFASPGNIIELIDRLEAAEKVCKYVYQNTGMHCSAIGKCIVCNKASTRALDMVCDRCITEAVLAWQKVKEGQ